jgi:hypothetical protein
VTSFHVVDIGRSGETPGDLTTFTRTWKTRAGTIVGSAKAPASSSPSYRDGHFRQARGQFIAGGGPNGSDVFKIIA